MRTSDIKTVTVAFRITVAQYNILYNRALKQGKTVAKYLRDSVLNKLFIDEQQDGSPSS